MAVLSVVNVCKKRSASELIVIRLILDNLIRSTSCYPTKLGKDGEAILLPRVLPEEARLLALHRGTRGRILHRLCAGAVIL
jgi:hypothetical protein